MDSKKQHERPKRNKIVTGAESLTTNDSTEGGKNVKWKSESEENKKIKRKLLMMPQNQIEWDRVIG